MSGITVNGPIIQNANDNILLGNNNLTGSSATNSVAIGINALENCTENGNQIAIGNEALYLSNSSYNIGIGYQALSQSNNEYNIAIGDSSGKNITNGIHNTIIGNDSLSNVQSGNFNTVIGSLTFPNTYNETLEGCTFVGFQSGIGVKGNNCSGFGAFLDKNQVIYFIIQLLLDMVHKLQLLIKLN
jgi:hypothetical protein